MDIASICSSRAITARPLASWPVTTWRTCIACLLPVRLVHGHVPPARWRTTLGSHAALTPARRPPLGAAIVVDPAQQRLESKAHRCRRAALGECHGAL